MSPKEKMFGKGYEPIPDVKNVESSNSDDLSPQDRYPEANEEEAELLGLLDEFIKESSISVKLPSVSIYNFSMSSSCVDYLCSLLLPTICFLLNNGVAVFLIGNGSFRGWVEVIFPYAAALLGFLGSAVPMQKRLTQHSGRIESMVNSTKGVAVKTVEDVATSVSSKVDLVKMKLCNVVLAMRPKLDKASKEEQNLKKMDPSIEIPDPNDIVSELDGAKGEIQESVHMVEEIIPVTPWIPEHLRSPELYQSRVINKVLLICFALQMIVAVYGMLQFFPSGTDMEGSVASSKNQLMGSVASAIARILTFNSGNGDATTLSEQISTSTIRAWPFPLAVVLLVYLMSIVQLAFVFYRTRASATVATINRVRSTVTEQTNLVLRQQGIIFLCQDILEIRMGRVRSNLLKMISLMFKIDMLMSMAATDESSPSSPGRSSVGSLTPKSPSARKRISDFFANSP